MENTDKTGSKKFQKIMKLDTFDFDQEIFNSNKHMEEGNVEEARKSLENAEKILNDYEISPKEMKLYRAEILSTKIKINRWESRKNMGSADSRKYDIYLLSDSQDVLENARLLLNDAKYLYDEAVLLGDSDMTGIYEKNALSSSIASALDAECLLTELERTSQLSFPERDELNEVLFDCYQTNKEILLTDAKKKAVEGLPKESFEFMKRAVVCQKMAEKYMPVEKRIDAYDIRRISDIMKNHLLPGSDGFDFEKQENEILAYMASDGFEKESDVSIENQKSNRIFKMAGEAYSRLLESTISFFSDSKSGNTFKNHGYEKK